MSTTARVTGCYSSSQQLTVVCMQIAEALACVPSLLVLKDLHLLCPQEAAAGEPTSSPHSEAITDWLCDVLQQLSIRRKGASPWPGGIPRRQSWGLRNLLCASAYAPACSDCVTCCISSAASRRALVAGQVMYLSRKVPSCCSSMCSGHGSGAACTRTAKIRTATRERSYCRLNSGNEHIGGS